MYAKDIDTTDKKAMIAYLENHPRYYTLNSWNGLTSYSNNVKLHKLPIPDDLVDKAYEFIGLEHPEFDMDCQDLIQDFEYETGYSIGVNGRSGGYLVMYDTILDEKSKTRKTICHSVDSDADFSEWSMDELRDRTKIVMRFDKLCDDIIDLFIDHLQRCDIDDVVIIRKEIERAISYPVS